MTEFKLRNTAVKKWVAHFRKHIKSWVKYVQVPWHEFTANDLVLITGCVVAYDWAVARLEAPGRYTLNIDISEEIRTELFRGEKRVQFDVSHRPTQEKLLSRGVTTQSCVQYPRTIFTRGITAKTIPLTARIVAAAEPRDPKSERDSEDALACLADYTTRVSKKLLVISRSANNINVSGILRCDYRRKSR